MIDVHGTDASRRPQHVLCVLWSSTSYALIEKSASALIHYTPFSLRPRHVPLTPRYFLSLERVAGSVTQHKLGSLSLSPASNSSNRTTFSLHLSLLWLLFSWSYYVGYTAQYMWWVYSFFFLYSKKLWWIKKKVLFTGGINLMLASFYPASD